MIGPVANSVCIVAGSILGALCGPVLSQEFRKKIMNVFSCITLGIGVTMLSKGDSLLLSCFPAVRNGARRADPLRIPGDEGGLQGGGAVQAERQTQGRQVRNAVRDGVPRSVRRGDGPFLCERPRDHRFHARRPDRRVFPPAHQGVLDLFTAMLISASIGSVVACWPFAVRHSVCLAVRGHDAHAVHHADHVLPDFSACGGIIMLGAGAAPDGLVQVPILSMLPGLFFVMPLSALWKQIM